MTQQHIPDYQIPSAGYSQESLLGDVPKVGERYQRVDRGWLATVISVRVDRRTWITLRYQGKLTDITLENFRRYWTRFDPRRVPGILGDAP